MPDTDSAGSDWHLDKKLSLFMLVGLLINLVATVASVSWLASKLTSDVEALKARPELTERVIRLEAVTQEQGRVLSQMSDILNRFDATLDRIAAEQNKRAGVIEWARGQQNGRH